MAKTRKLRIITAVAYPITSRAFSPVMPRSLILSSFGWIIHTKRGGKACTRMVTAMFLGLNRQVIQVEEVFAGHEVNSPRQG